MKILITGVAGFIGSHISESLLQLGHEVVGMDNFDAYYDRSIKETNLVVSQSFKNFSFIEADICEIQNFKEDLKRIELVIHLAAKVSVLPSVKNPAAYIHTNVLGTQAILEFMKTQKNKKIIFASSSSIYGNNDKVPFAETDVVDFPISPYAYTKKTGELMLHTYHHLYNIDVLCFRFFTVYGPRQRPDLAIHKFVRLIQNGQAITMYGDGSSARDYTSVFDIIAGIKSGIDYLLNHQNVYEVINLGNSSPITLKDMIATIAKHCPIQPTIRQISNQPGDVKVTYADIAKAKNVLNYQPKVSFDVGVKDFVDWFKASLVHHL